MNSLKMKNLFLFVLCFASLLSSAVLKAQYAVPNGSFENWTSVNKPADWNVVQGKPNQGHLFRYLVIDSAASTDTTTDSVYLEMYAKDGSSFINMPMRDTSSPCIISQKFPMTARPVYFSMNYAYVPETRYNQFQVSFIFTKWNATTHQEDTVLAGDYNSEPGHLDSAWQTLKVADLTSLYNTGVTGNPDSALIVITSSLQTSPYAKTVLAIDEIYFTDTAVTTGIKPVRNKNLSTSNAFPNPFSDKTTIGYNLTKEGQVSLDVYDMEGKQIASLVNGIQASGSHSEVFDASVLTNGVYIYRLRLGDEVKTGKLILEK